MRRHVPDWAAELPGLALAGGRIRKARWNPGGRTLELLLRAPEGDGWSEVLLRYRNVERLEPSLPELARQVEDPLGELAGHSLGAASGGWQHELVLRAGPPLRVRFSDLYLSRTPVAGPEAELDGGHRFEVLSC